MDPLARRIINGLQTGFLIVPRPFAAAANALSMQEDQLIKGVNTLLQEGFLTRFGPFFNVERMGGGFTLAAMSIPEAEFASVTEIMNQQPEIAHNYARDHELNMWFVVATEQKAQIAEVILRIESLTGHAVFDLPKLEEYRLGFQLHLSEDGTIDTKPLPAPTNLLTDPAVQPNPLDRAIILATQAGLPLVPEPYLTIAQNLEVEVDTLLVRLQNMLSHGWIRRIGAATNHYRLGLQGNGMSVWDLPDDKISQLGQTIGALDFVTHCYRRPRHPPAWPYNLFVMVHGPDREAVEKKIEFLVKLLGENNRGHRVLHSTRILKKTGFRMHPLGGE